MQAFIATSSLETIEVDLCRPASSSELLWGGGRHDVALLRMISPVNRGPQRATARRQYIGSCLTQEAEAPTQQDPRATRQVYEEIQLAGSLHILVGKGSSSPDHIWGASCHHQHRDCSAQSSSKSELWSCLALWSPRGLASGSVSLGYSGTPSQGHGQGTIFVAGLNSRPR